MNSTERTKSWRHAQFASSENDCNVMEKSLPFVPEGAEKQEEKKRERKKKEKRCFQIVNQI